MLREVQQQHAADGAARCVCLIPEISPTQHSNHFTKSITREFTAPSEIKT